MSLFISSLSALLSINFLLEHFFGAEQFDYGCAQKNPSSILPYAFLAGFFQMRTNEISLVLELLLYLI